MQTSLLFKHDFNVRITVNLRAGTGISEEALHQATVMLPAFTTSHFIPKSDGDISIITGSVSNPVSPHERIPATTGYIRTFDAVVVVPLLQYDPTVELIRIVIGDKNYSYQKKKNESLYFKDNCHYTYNVTVNDDGLTLAFPTSGTWVQNGEDENIESKDAKSTSSNNP